MGRGAAQCRHLSLYWKQMIEYSWGRIKIEVGGSGNCVYVLYCEGECETPNICCPIQREWIIVLAQSGLIGPATFCLAIKQRLQQRAGLLFEQIKIKCCKSRQWQKQMDCAKVGGQ